MELKFSPPFKSSKFFLVLILFLVSSFLTSNFANAREEVDKSLQPAPEEADAISRVFRDMIVVQRKAKQKAHKFLFAPYGSFDFSDGPTTMYGLNLNVGYALSDYWEVYANYVPTFITSEREVVRQVHNLTLADGSTANLSYATPKSQYGLEVLWAPAYGKDSWGPYSIVRSDTFIKMGLGVINYSSDVGSRYNLAIGKTFFLSRFFNLRLDAGASYLQAIINNQKKYYVVSIIESGVVWYF